MKRLVIIVCIANVVHYLAHAAQKKTAATSQNKINKQEWRPRTVTTQANTQENMHSTTVQMPIETNNINAVTTEVKEQEIPQAQTEQKCASEPEIKVKASTSIENKNTIFSVPLNHQELNHLGRGIPRGLPRKS